MVDQSTEVMGAMLRPFSNENGLITNALLLWLDIQRKPTAENIWKTQALSHFTEEEITDAKNMLWSNCDESLTGKHIRRQGTSKTSNELEGMSAALRMLDESQKMPTFIASSEMVMKTPTFNADTAACNNDVLATRIKKLEETISTALSADKGNILHGKRDSIQSHSTNDNPAANSVYNKTTDKHVSWADVVTTNNVGMPHIDLSTNTSIADGGGFINNPLLHIQGCKHQTYQHSFPVMVHSKNQLLSQFTRAKLSIRAMVLNIMLPSTKYPMMESKKNPKKVWYMVLNMTHPSLQLTWR